MRMLEILAYVIKTAIKISRLMNISKIALAWKVIMAILLITFDEILDTPETVSVDYIDKETICKLVCYSSFTVLLVTIINIDYHFY